MWKYKKPRQLTIFDQITFQIQDCYSDGLWAEFEPKVDKLIEQFGKKKCPIWWRSRYHEEIICPKHSRNKRGYEFEKIATKCWEEIFKRIQKKI